MTKFVVTDCGEALTLTKCDRATVIFDGRFEERAIYVADDGSYWARYSNRWNELGVTTYYGSLHFHGDWLRFAN